MIHLSGFRRLNKGVFRADRHLSLFSNPPTPATTRAPPTHLLLPQDPDSGRVSTLPTPTSARGPSQRPVGIVLVTSLPLCPHLQAILIVNAESLRLIHLHCPFSRVGHSHPPISLLQSTLNLCPCLSDAPLPQPGNIYDSIYVTL